jgi:hypothetical protein
MTILHNGRASSITGPAEHGFTITPDDDADLVQPARALYVGSTGAVAVTLPSGAHIVLHGFVGGTVLPIRVMRLHATGTTAGDIVGLV